MAKSEYESIKAMMDSEDIRISKALEMKELCGYSVAEIAAELNISQPRIYQLSAELVSLAVNIERKTAKTEKGGIRTDHSGAAAFFLLVSKIIATTYPK